MCVRACAAALVDGADAAAEEGGGGGNRSNGTAGAPAGEGGAGGSLAGESVISVVLIAALATALPLGVLVLAVGFCYCTPVHLQAKLMALGGHEAGGGAGPGARPEPAVLTVGWGPGAREHEVEVLTQAARWDGRDVEAEDKPGALPFMEQVGVGCGAWGSGV